MDWSAGVFGNWQSADVTISQGSGEPPANISNTIGRIVESLGDNSLWFGSGRPTGLRWYRFGASVINDDNGSLSITNGFNPGNIREVIRR